MFRPIGDSYVCAGIVSSRPEENPGALHIEKNLLRREIEGGQRYYNSKWHFLQLHAAPTIGFIFDLLLPPHSMQWHYKYANFGGHPQVMHHRGHVTHPLGKRPASIETTFLCSFLSFEFEFPADEIPRLLL